MDQPRHTSFLVDGMTCAGCARRVERAATAVPGVQSASVNLATRMLHADFVAPATAGGLAEALDRAGYPAVIETLPLTIEGMTCAGCAGKVERTLTGLPGSVGATVNLATRTGEVRFLAGTLSPTEITETLRRAGYPAAVPVSGAPPRPDPTIAEAADLRRQLILAAGLTLPVFVLAMGGHAIPAFHHWIVASLGEGTSWVIQFGLTTLVLAVPGRGFLSRGLPLLARAEPDMNSLVALGALAAWVYSTLATFAPALLPEAARSVYFEAAAMIVTLILLGRMLETRARGQAGQAIRRLIDLQPATARVIRATGSFDLPPGELRVGDLVQVRPGERIATDGTVTEGESWVDRSMLTGEPAPVAVAIGAKVVGGTINGAGAFSFAVTQTGAGTVLSRIIRLVEQAQGDRLPVQTLVDRVTHWFVPGVIALALATVAAWLIWGPSLAQALVAGVSVLIIACPCAMGLATPTSILVGTGRGAELGLLFRQGSALQRLDSVRVVAFDKTGTLTEGHPVLTDLIAAAGQEDAQVLALAAATEARSEHPLARAVLAAAEARGLTLPLAEAFRALPGIGVVAHVGAQQIAVGAEPMLAHLGARPDPALTEAARDLAAEGKTAVFVVIDGQPAALLAVADPVRPTSAAALAALRARGLHLAMITGDAAATAAVVARRLGIETVLAGVLPDGKVAAVQALRAAHGPVAFVGDGINDAPALAAADIGIAIGTGTDVAIEAADLVLMSGDPGGVVTAHRLSHATMANIRQNLFWAFGYNVALIPVAAGALVPFGGPMLSPMLAAAAMAASSVLVVANALRLRRAGGPSGPGT